MLFRIHKYKEMKHIAIIGNGISGVTLARHIRKNSDHKITLISEETDYFFSRTALMYIYMGHMKFEHTQPYEPYFWSKNRIDLLKKRVTHVRAEDSVLDFEDGSELPYDELVIATGSKPNKFGWPGQDLEGVQGLYFKQDVETLEKNAPNNKVCKRAVIVGGGLIGIEMAEMLYTRNIPVTFLVREKSFWNKVLPSEESAMINREIRTHHIDLQLDTNLVEIIGDENGKVKAITTDKGETIPCEVVGLTAGVSPNIAFLKDSQIATNQGVLVDRFLRTNIPNIYAIGDCAEQHEAIGLRRPVEAVWYTGRMMGEALAQTLCGKPTQYNPGNWFNSAKFFDIEYQTYGWVWPTPMENERHLYWENQKGNLAMRMAYDVESRKFLGVNTMGIRLRHSYFDFALNNNWTIDQVVSELKNANFDPEFYRRYEAEIAEAYGQQMGVKLTLNKSTWKKIFAKSYAK